MKHFMVIIIIIIINCSSSYCDNNGIIINKDIQNNDILDQTSLDTLRKHFKWPTDEEIHSFRKVINRYNQLKSKYKNLETKVSTPDWAKEDCYNWLKSYILKKEWLPNNGKENLVLEQVDPSGDSRVLLKYKKNGFDIQMIFTQFNTFIVIDPPEYFIRGLVNEEICHKVFKELFVFGEKICEFKINDSFLLDQNTKLFYIKNNAKDSLRYYASRFWLLQNKKVGIFLNDNDPFLNSTLRNIGDPWF